MMLESEHMLTHFCPTGELKDFDPIRWNLIIAHNIIMNLKKGQKK